MTLNLKTAATAVMFAAPKQGVVEVAAYTSPTNEDVLISVANQTPFNPVNGEQMQIASSRRENISAKMIETAFVPVGKCSHCHSNLIASASLADNIEVSGEDFHCPVCTAMVTPDVDTMKLVRALAAEFNDDPTEDDAPMDEDMGDDDVPMDEDMGDDGDLGDDMGDDGDLGDDMGDDGDLGDDSGDDEVDYSDDDLGDYSDDDGDLGDDTDEVPPAEASLRARRRVARAADEDVPVDDEEVVDPTVPENLDPEDTAIAAMVSRSRRRRRAAVAEDVADEDAPVDDASDDVDMGDDDDAIEEAAAQLRRKIALRKRRRAATANDGDMDEDDLGGMNVDTDGDDVGEDAPVDDGEMVAALASFVRREYKRQGLRLPATAASRGNTIAGKPVENAAVTKALESAKSLLRSAGYKIADGNRKLRTSALADLDEAVPALVTDPPADTALDRMSNETPGTNPDEVDAIPTADENVPTPGTSEAADTTDNPGGMNVDPVDGDSEDMSAEATVDWRRENIELVASGSTPDRWVMVGGRPIARLVRENASENVRAIWDGEVLATSFLHVARNGLAPAEAKDFGFSPVRYRVQASDVMRNAMRRAAELSTENAQNLAKVTVERHRQALRTSLLAAVKGVVPDVKNPIRNQLIAEMAKLGVHDPRTVVDKAFASGIDELATSVFSYADSLAAKPDAARNEAAAFVATAVYQSREVDTGAELAANLVKGSTSVSPLVDHAIRTAKSEEASKTSTGDNSQAAKVRLALRSIGR